MSKRARFKYDLFASYATYPDYELVRDVERFLESFHTLQSHVDVQLRPLQVCVDGSDFSLPPQNLDDTSSSTIAKIIEDYLQESRELLVFCSANAARSPWIRHEVCWFLEHRGRQAIRLAITEGNDPQSARETFFPKELIDVGRLDETIWYDLRRFRGHEAEGWHKLADFEEQRTRLAADILGVSAGDVHPGWVRRQLQVETRRADLADAQRLAAESRFILTEYPQRSLLLAVEALRATPRDEPSLPAPWQALRDATEHSSGMGLCRHTRMVAEIACSPDGRRLASAAWDDKIILWDLRDADPGRDPQELGQDMACRRVAFSPDGRWLVAGGSCIRVWDLESDDMTRTSITFAGEDANVTALAIGEDSRTVLSCHRNGAVYLWKLAPGIDPQRMILREAGCREVRSAAISPNGEWLAVPGFVWRSPAGSTVDGPIQLSRPMLGKRPIAFSPNAQWLAVANQNQTALWELAREDRFEERIELSGHLQPVRAVAFSPDSLWLATASIDKTIRLWPLHDAGSIGHSMQLSGHEKMVTCLAFSSDGRWLATGSDDKSVRLWNMNVTSQERLQDRKALDLNSKRLSNQHVVLRGHDGAVTAVAVSPESEKLVTAGKDGSLRVWDLAQPNTSIYLGYYRRPASVALAAQRDRLAVACLGHRRITLVDVDGGEPTGHASLEVPMLSPEVGFTPDGRWLVAHNSDFALWDLESGIRSPRRVSLEVADSPVAATKFSPDGRWLLAARRRSPSILLDLRREDPAAKPTLLRRMGKADPAFAFSASGRWLVAGVSGRRIRFWDLGADDPARATYDLAGHDEPGGYVAISQDDRFLVTGSVDGHLRCWQINDANPGDNSVVFEGHHDELTRLEIQPDGRWLVTASRDDVLAWDMCSSGAALTPVELPEGARQPAQAPSISPDGRWLVTRGHDGIVHLTELSSPDFPNRTLVLRGHEGVAHRHAFSANSRFLATTAGHAIHLWDLAADDPANALMLLRGHQDRVLRMVFSASGTTLITASMDWTVRIWNLRTDTLEASARTLAGRNLTRTEWASYFPEREYRETFPSVERT